jgi:hypothetical protein
MQHMTAIMTEGGPRDGEVFWTACNTRAEPRYPIHFYRDGQTGPLFAYYWDPTRPVQDDKLAFRYVKVTWRVRLLWQWLYRKRWTP